MKHTDKKSARRLAKEHIKALFLQAGEVFRKDSELADRYVRKARRLAMKHRLRLGSEVKKRFCVYCGKYWIPGKTVRVRLQKHKVVYYCLNCKKYTRHPYVKEQKERRKKFIRDKVK